MKKIAVLVLTLVLALTLTGCMGGGTAAETLTVMEVPETDWTEGTYPDFSSYNADLEGLCAFMEDGGVVVADDNYPVDTAYDVIGAVGGKRYKFTYNNSTVQAEFYEFDPADLSGEAQALLADAQVQGQVTILRNTVPAAASDNNQFLMIYIDVKDNDANKAHREMANSYFANFCANKE